MLQFLLRNGSGNLTPPVSVYNSTFLSDAITISGLPLGIIAILINAMLLYGIYQTINHLSTPYRPTYSLYFHIAICDLLNGVVGVVTSGFLLQNLRYPIDPDWALKFCAYLAPLPTCVIRLLLYLMTLMAVLRVYIVTRPSATDRVTRLKLNMTIMAFYFLSAGLFVWFFFSSVEVMALPDGWCVYYTTNYTTSDRLFTVLADAGPVLLCSLLIILCLVVIYRKVDHVTLHGGEEAAPLLQNRIKTVQVARSIVNHILVTFLLCYSVSLYIELRQILMAAGIVVYDYILFTQPDGPPMYNAASLLIFRLKFTTTILFSIINPLLVFRSSAVFRQGVRNFFNRDNFNYVVSQQTPP